MSIYSERSLKKVVLLSIIVAPLFSCVQHKETLVAERENASLPYAALHRMASLAQTSGGKLIVRSKLPDVPPQAIEYTIESKNDTILLRVTQDGILDVPLSQTLLEENPLVVVNQPKGSLVIEGDFKMLRSQADKGSNTQKSSRPIPSMASSSKTRVRVASKSRRSLRNTKDTKSQFQILSEIWPSFIARKVTFR